MQIYSNTGQRGLGGRPLQDLTGKRFGRLVVLERALNMLAGRQERTAYLCQCDCGTIKPVVGLSLRKGRTKSCGCLRIELGREKLRRSHESV